MLAVTTMQSLAAIPVVSTSRAGRRRVQAAALVFVAAVGVGSWAATSESAPPDQPRDRVITLVNGDEVRESEVLGYASVFKQPDGTIAADPSEVLESVINQHIVERYAAGHGMSASDDEVHDHQEELHAEVGAEAFARLNSRVDPQQYRRNVELFILFQKVRASVIPRNVVSPQDQEAAAQRGPEGSPEYSNALEMSRRGRENVAWARWLQIRRAEADVVMMSTPPTWR